MLFFSVPAFAQKLAILTPDENETSRQFANALNNSLGILHVTTDFDLANAVLRTQAPEQPYNQTAVEARALGNGIGCGHFVLIKTGTLRRASLEKDKYFEAFAAVYVVSSKTGRLRYWTILSFEDETPENAIAGLIKTTGGLAIDISERIKQDAKDEPRDNVDNSIATEVTDGRPPLPYQRLKPNYTNLAKQYQIEATVDIEADIDKDGGVIGTRIVRWAGFGLDESVENVVRTMQWRPADRKGKTLAMRVLLRYNFKELDDPID